jgi:hypothetical protein
MRLPVNAYGLQRLQAEREVMACAERNTTIVRPTFVLGVRPLPLTGRQNPVEQMLSAAKPIVEGGPLAVQRHVNNRWFSVSFAWDVSASLCNIATAAPSRTPVHVCIPYRTSRFDLASYLRKDVEPIRHEDCVGQVVGGVACLAERPLDTTYEGEGGTLRQITLGLDRCKAQYISREKLTVYQRSCELSLFEGKRQADCQDQLLRGFQQLHREVANEWRELNPQTDGEILERYHNTDAFLYELSASRFDADFNCTGAYQEIARALKAKGCTRAVLCLDDGIGDLTLYLLRAGIPAIYHGWKGSKTAAFAEMRIQMYTGFVETALTSGWVPETPQSDLAAIISLGFVERVADVHSWLSAIFAAIRPGGWFYAQSVLGIGAGTRELLPIRFPRNDRSAEDYLAMMAGIGFVREGTSNWWRKPK